MVWQIDSAAFLHPWRVFEKKSDNAVASTVVKQRWRQHVEATAMNSFRMCNLQSRDYSYAIWYIHAITTAMVQSVYCKIYTGLVAIGT